MMSPQDRGKLGYAARRQTATGHDIARGLLDGRERAIAAKIDPTGELAATDPQEYRQRRHAFFQAWSIRQNALKKGKAQRKANAAIREIASPKSACCYCCVERDVPMSRDATHRTCATHQQLTAVEMTQLAIRAAQLRQA